MAAKYMKSNTVSMQLIAGPPGASTGSGDRQDAQQKLVAALAKAALGQVRMFVAVLYLQPSQFSPCCFHPPLRSYCCT